MSTVAEQIRRARESQKLTVHQMADTTKIKTDHIRALEEGNFAPFSAPVYIRGHIKALARQLRLDVPRVMSELDEELSQHERFREPPSLIPRNKGVLDWIMLRLSKLNLPLVLPLLALGLVIFLSIWGYTAWRRHRSTDPLADLGPGYYQAPSPRSNVEYLPLPATPTNNPASR